MGKRKKAAKKPTGQKKNEPLATTFACLFCNHEKSVTIKLDKKAGVGQLSCKVCGQSFQCGVNYLSAAVDVYSEWVDACDTVAKENTEHHAGGDFVPFHIAATDRARVGGRRNGDHDNDDDENDAHGYEGDGIVADDEY
jgi:transcription elongation factor Elf1